MPPLPAFFDSIHQSQDHDGSAKDDHDGNRMGGFDHALLRRGEAYTHLTMKRLAISPRRPRPDPLRPTALEARVSITFRSGATAPFLSDCHTPATD